MNRPDSYYAERQRRTDGQVYRAFRKKKILMKHRRRLRGEPWLFQAEGRETGKDRNGQRERNPHFRQKPSLGKTHASKLLLIRCCAECLDTERQVIFIPANRARLFKHKQRHIYKFVAEICVL